jgi:hypothetical protein
MIDATRRGERAPRAWQQRPRLFAILGAWVLVTLLLGETGYVALTAEYFGLLLATGYLVVGRGGWGWPFAAWFAALVALDQLGMLANLGGPPHATDVIAFEHRLLGFDAVTMLQSAWHHSTLQWWDYLLTAVYWMHSYAPVLLGILLWRWRRNLFRPFVASIVVAGLVALVVYIVFPETPPWLAGIRGQMPPVHRIAADVLHRATWMYTPWYGAGGRPEGAMPSMHAGIAVLVAFWAIRAWGWRAAAVVAYPMAMTIAVVYLGEHFAVDAIAGAILAAVGVAGARMVERRLDGRPHLHRARSSDMLPLHI